MFKCLVPFIYEEASGLVSREGTSVRLSFCVHILGLLSPTQHASAPRLDAFYVHSAASSRAHGHANAARKTLTQGAQNLASAFRSLGTLGKRIFNSPSSSSSSSPTSSSSRAAQGTVSPVPSSLLSSSSSPSFPPFPPTTEGVGRKSHANSGGGNGNDGSVGEEKGSVVGGDSAGTSTKAAAAREGGGSENGDSSLLSFGAGFSIYGGDSLPLSRTLPNQMRGVSNPLHPHARTDTDTAHTRTTDACTTADTVTAISTAASPTVASRAERELPDSMGSIDLNSMFGGPDEQAMSDSSTGRAGSAHASHGHTHGRIREAVVGVEAATHASTRDLQQRANLGDIDILSSIMGDSSFETHPSGGTALNTGLASPPPAQTKEEEILFQLDMGFSSSSSSSSSSPSSPSPSAIPSSISSSFIDDIPSQSPHNTTPSTDVFFQQSTPSPASPAPTSSIGISSTKQGASSGRQEDDIDPFASLF